MEKDDHEIDEDLETDEDIDDSEDDFEEGLPLNGSPSYPRIFVGESAKPLHGQYDTSAYIDDNIHRTYQGLLSYYG